MIQAQKTPSDWSGPNRLQSVFLICRCAFWWFFHQFSLHYFYHSAMQYHPGTVIFSLEEFLFVFTNFFFFCVVFVTLRFHSIYLWPSIMYFVQI